MCRFALDSASALRHSGATVLGAGSVPRQRVPVKAIPGELHDAPPPWNRRKHHAPVLDVHQHIESAGH